VTDWYDPAIVAAVDQLCTALADLRDPVGEERVRAALDVLLHQIFARVP
jgi:hypothetical protein